MRISVGLELDNEGRALAYALDFPGCFAYGAEGPDAVISLPRALLQYQHWVTRHAGPGWLELGDFDIRVVDTWQVYTINDDYEVTDGGYAVNAWFRDDWRPLQSQEVERGLALLEWSRRDLLDLLASIPAGQLDQTYPNQRWSLRGIARHVASAEWWYLNRLGLAEGGREALPADLYERLGFVRSRLVEALPQLVGQVRVLGKEGEFWSPRKLLRRALWHEIDHREHIRALFQAAY